MSTDIHRWWSYYSGRSCGARLLDLGTSKTGHFCPPVVPFFVCYRKVCTTWVCCRKVIQQPKLTFLIYTLKVKVATLRQNRSFVLYGQKMEKISLLKKISTCVYFTSLWTQILGSIFKWRSLSSTSFQLYSGGLTRALKNSCAFETGSLLAAGVLDLPGEFHLVGSPGSVALHSLYSLCFHYSRSQVVQSLWPLLLLL